MLELPKFHDLSLIEQALTHKSYCNERPEQGLPDNQRLEFLGDAVLGFLVGVLLYNLYPELPEGELTRRRSALVDQPRLSEFATQLNLGDLLRMGRGVEKERGRQNPSILSDAFEALIGAYFLDSGIDAVREYVEELLTPIAKQMGSEAGCTIDPKSLFQQWALANLGPDNPKYRIAAESGPDHAKTFTAEVLVGDRIYGRGSDRSKREAEKRAAEDALQQLGAKRCNAESRTQSQC
jgi:ribonuclease-3